MNVFSLIEPSFKRFSRVFTKRNPETLALIIIGAIALSTGIYYGMARFLGYVSKAPLLGDSFGVIIGGMLVSKFLEMLFMTMLFMLLFSGITSAISMLFLDDELQVLMVSPQPVSKIFLSRFFLMTLDSSWMAAVFFAPVFLAFATTLNAFWPAYLLFPIALVFFIFVPNIIGALGSLLLAAFFPIRQMKKVFQFLSILVLTCLVFFLRSLEAEKLLNPSHFRSVSSYLINLELPLIAYSPTSWIHGTTLNLFYGRFAEAFKSFLPLFFTVILSFFIMWFLAKKYYHFSWQRSCEAMDNQVIGLEWLRKLLIMPFAYTAPDYRVIASKEITTFMRDPAAFSQIFMMVAVILVYAYNLYILPIKDIPEVFSQGLNNALVYLNGPFIGFVLASIGMRFVYPSVSMEGRAFWSVKSSPVPPRRVLIIKVLFYMVPMLLLGLILCGVTNAIFTVSTPALTWTSYINVILITIVITSLAIGVGSINADFSEASPLKVAGSYGGLVYMLLAGLYIVNLVLLETYPIYSFNFIKTYHMRGIMPPVLFILSLLLILVITAVWIYLPIRKGLDSIEKYEPE